ncbi:MAG: hypothetical protein E7363_06450 [Clostridiales bacterium]|nr:hypothetical protein [Clostridiales bacterium]
MNNFFSTAYEILNRVYADGAFLKIALQDLPEDAENRALVTKLCYGTVETDAKYHLQISRLTKGKQLKPHVRLILKMAMFLLCDLRRPPYATVSVAVDFSKTKDKGASAGLINAVLRNFLREGMQIVLPERKFERLAATYGYPLFAVKRLFHTYGEEAERIMQGATPVNSIRFHKGTDGEAYLTERGIAYETSPFFNVFFVHGFSRDEGYKKGQYTFQSVGSVAICDMIEGADALLDVCAAPGGKSVYLAEKCGTVMAGELHAHRVGLIEDYAKRMHANNVTAVNQDGTVFNPAWRESFSAVLCDVPCSGYGVLKENPDILLRSSDRDFSSLTPVQTDILQTASAYVKKGGNLYYSTCTLFKEENDEVVGAFLKRNPNFSMEKTTSPLPGKSTKYGLQFLPHTAYGAGFYFCKLKRNV